jgi:hypothetical protein
MACFAAPLDVKSLARAKLPNSLIGRDWLWNKIVRAVHRDNQPILVLEANSGRLLATHRAAFSYCALLGFGKSAISVELFERQLAILRLKPLAFHICSYTAAETVR